MPACSGVRLDLRVLHGMQEQTMFSHVGRAVVLTRHNVVEIQVARVEFLAAILAGVLVALKNIVAGES